MKRVSIIPRNLKISEVSENFLSFHRQTSTNYLAVRRSCTIHFFNVNFKGLMNWFSLKNTANCTTFVHGSKKILHNSFWKTWHKISNAPGDVNIVNTSTFKTSNEPGDVHTNIFENSVINAKPKPFSVNKRKKHSSIFRSSHQINNLKPTLITSLKKIDAIHLV